MMTFSIVIFGISLVAIGGLFVLKHWEVGTGRTLAPAVRHNADHQALELKNRLLHLRYDLARVPPFLVLYARYLVHEGALGVAAFAQMSERQAHRLADLVSHKHGFVPRETRSEFLRQVSEHKNGGIER
jgi:hypothetical protein